MNTTFRATGFARVLQKMGFPPAMIFAILLTLIPVILTMFFIVFPIALWNNNETIVSFMVGYLVISTVFNWIKKGCPFSIYGIFSKFAIYACLAGFWNHNWFFIIVGFFAATMFMNLSEKATPKAMFHI